MPRGGKRTGAGRKPKAADQVNGKPGRPSCYKPEFAEQARKLCELGATDLEVANFFEIAVRSLYLWKTTYPEFNSALKAGKAAADDRVERSLYNRAVGYSFQSEKVFQYQGSVVRAETTEHVPPETTAAIFWLKNRRGEAWRDKSEVVHKRGLDELSYDELVRIAAQGSGGAPGDFDPGRADKPDKVH